MSVTTSPAAVAAYGSLAPCYDAFTSAYRHDQWMTSLARLARRHGLADGRVLDVACGTGKSLKALIDLGFDASGCDLSPEMLSVARQTLPGGELLEADMRALPDLGTFAWITCINDALNHLLDDGDLEAALCSMGSMLMPGGLLAFDLNSARAHRRAFSATWAVEDAGTFMCWQGRGCDTDSDGTRTIGRSDIVIFTDEDGTWQRTVSPHVERYWSDEDVSVAAAASDLEVVRVYGQRTGCVIDPHVDPDVHSRLVYFLRRPGPIATERGDRPWWWSRRRPVDASPRTSDPPGRG